MSDAGVSFQLVCSVVKNYYIKTNYEAMTSRPATKQMINLMT